MIFARDSALAAARLPAHLGLAEEARLRLALQLRSLTLRGEGHITIVMHNKVLGLEVGCIMFAFKNPR